MAETPDDQTSEKAEQTTQEACPVEMYGGTSCGRPIYHAPSGFRDHANVCLMHSRDPDKDDAAFQAEFQRILRETQERVADFSKFVFPGLDFRRKGFSASCIFADVVFLRAARFDDAEFAREAIFARAEFKGRAEFHSAKFTGKADFTGAEFNEDADFRGTNFMEYTAFNAGIFNKDAYFIAARFKSGAYFDLVKFRGETYFSTVVFEQRADFSCAQFTSHAEFIAATFTKAANFRETTFTEFANLNAAFLDEVRFDRTEFREDSKLEPGPVFTGARFDQPELVLFYGTHLGQALFHHCDVTKLVFSDVRWRIRASSAKRMVFEEDVELRGPHTHALQTGLADPNPRNYRLIAEVYQQLKKNYDDRRDYWTAGDFHYGEMEMKRLSTPRRSRLLRWLHCNLGLVALYKYASEYGESYVLPTIWLLVMVLAFALVYPLVGLRTSGNKPQSGERVAIRASDNLGLAEAYSGHNFVTALGVAFFQRDLPYEPSYPWGRLLSWFQLLLTSTLIALFLLALRRQFRR